MKLFVVFTFIALLSSSNQRPGIVWNKTYKDFGTVRQGDTLHTSFKYYNHSDTGFIIENIQASCGCVVSKWNKNTLKVGDSAEIQVSFDTHHKSKTHEKTITIYSSHGLYELILKANIQKP